MADAAGEVQAASSALEEHFKAERTEAPTLQLARLAAAMSELQKARDAFDALLASKRALGTSCSNSTGVQANGL